MDSILPFITIVMPVRNEEKFIRGVLIELIDQDYPKDRFEIIVVDGESTDSTYDILRELAYIYTQIIIITNPKRLSSYGRNLGFINGKGDIFLVIDGHCKIGNKHLLRSIVECFEKSGAQCLGRPQPLDPPGLSKFQKAFALARASKLGHSKNSYIYSNYQGFVSPVSHGAIYKREVFEKIGYVDESFDACEDVEFNYRVEKAGFKTYMNPSLTIKYYPRENLKGLFRQMKRYGEGRYKLFRKFPDAFNVEAIIPALFLLGLMGIFSLTLWYGVSNYFFFILDKTGLSYTLFLVYT